jgi:signal transduction histidine kinase
MTTRRAPSRIVPRAFPGIRPDEIEALIAHSTIHTYEPGTIICHENAVEDRFYMILDGEAEVTKNINNNEVRVLKMLYPGDFFGEMALIHNAPRAASVTVKTPLTALELDKAAFHQVLHNSTSIALAMISEISDRLRQNDQMAVDDLRMRASELAEAYQKLAEQEVARREFLSSIAHQLRTPLMAATGYLQLLQKGILSGDQLKSGIDTVSRNVQQIATLVNDILFLQEMELVLPDFQAVDLNEIARQVVERYTGQAAERNIKLRLTSYPGLPPVSGDARSLERALMALVENAIKFSPAETSVEIRTDLNGEKILVRVEDHGIGISEEALPRVFDRFYHLDRSGNELFDGIGLGLAITRQVIEQHHGSLDVTSEPGKGSTFTITLRQRK